MKKVARIILKTVLWTLGLLVILFITLVLLLRLPPVQNFVVGKVTGYLETKIGTPVRIGYINITFPKKLVLEDIYFEDQTRDTLLSGDRLLVDINMLKLLDNTVEIQEIDLDGITAKIKRTSPDGNFNFDYIMKAFVSEDKAPVVEDTTSALKFNIDKVNFDKIRFVYHDDMIGTSANIWLNHFDTRIENFDLENNMAFSLPKIKIDGLTAEVKQWKVTSSTDSTTAEDFGIETASSTSSSLMPELITENIDLKNIFITYQDSSSKMDTKFDIKNLSANIDKIDLNKQIVHIRELLLDESDSFVKMGKVTLPTVEAVQDTVQSAGWQVSVAKMALDKTNFWFKDDNQARMKGLDYFNIKITDLAGAMEELYYSTDSISGKLKMLTAKDHSGFILKKLQADFVYDNTGAEIRNLIAQTPHTIIRDYFKISYPSLESAMNNLNLMQIEANIAKTQIDMRDILYFVPDIQAMDVMKPLLTQKFYIDGKINGKVNDLRIPRVEFKTLDNTHIIASTHIKGLPDVEKMSIDLDLKKFTTSKRDLDRLIASSLMPEGIQFPSSISLSGTLKGGMTGFNTNMSLLTDKGNATVNGYLNMAGRDTTYDAMVTIDNFNIGHILGQDSTLGILAANAQIKGSGLNPKTMSADVDGKINRLDAMGYSYHDISMDLKASVGDIAGKIQSTDPNIRFNMDIAADMRDKYPKARLNLMIDSVNLKSLKLLDDNFRYHGKVVADFETADVDFLNGRLDVTQSSIAYNNDRYTLDTISIVATADTSRNTLIMRSQPLNAHLVGKYKLSELGASIQDILQVYYNPKNAPPAALQYEDQNFEFSATLTRSRFIRDFLPQLEQMSDVTIDGTFNSKEKTIMAKLLAPNILYDGIIVQNVGLDIITADSTLYYSTLIDRIKINNIELNNTVLSGQVVENNVDFGLWIKDKLSVNRYHLGAKMAILDNSFNLSLLEDGLMLNYDKWNINPGNVIQFGANGILARNFILSNNGQELTVQSQDSISNAPLDIRFNNFRIETFSKMLESDILNIGGGINGTATVSRLDTQPTFVSDLTIDKFYFGQDTIGNVLVKVNNEKENTFAADIRITENGNDVQLLGEYYAVPNQEATFNATVELKPLKMKTIEAFSLGYLEQCEGDLAGLLKISGTAKAPRINGDLTFNNAKLNIAMLNADFSMNNQKISFTDKGIQFRQFQLKDLRGNTAKLNGTVNTTNYTDYAFNLNLTTNDFAVVNSTREDNDLFFGKLNVTSNIRIRGDLDKPSIDGNIKANENTDFVFILPNDNPGIADRDGVVKFVDKSDTAQANVFAKLDSLTTAKTFSGFDMALNLSTDRDAKFKVIIDEGSQDALNIQGVAELNTAIDPSSKITMSGTFTVEDGSYSFSFGPVNREFAFQKGSTIVWNGDPLDARMDITAVYKNKFPTLELVATQIGNDNQNLYKQRIPFHVKLILQGELFKPDISFDISLDENNAIVSQDVVNKVNIGLSALREEPAEMNKQVFSLIILGRFIASNPFESLSGGGGIEGNVRNSVSQLLSSQLNKLASNLVKGVELDFNLQSEQDYLTGSGANRTDLNIGVSKMLFDDRLKITVGSNFEVEGNTRPGENPNNIAGDIALDYQLSKDGRYFARVYRKNQYQATLQGQFVETGIGFIINMSYDRFKELFMSSKALENYYNTDKSSFRRRFDVERMETDSVYRDSVRLVIRDSLMTHSPEFRKRMEERENPEELKKQQDSTRNNSRDSSSNSATRFRPKMPAYVENKERSANAK